MPAGRGSDSSAIHHSFYGELRMQKNQETARDFSVAVRKVIFTLVPRKAVGESPLVGSRRISSDDRIAKKKLSSR